MTITIVGINTKDASTNEGELLANQLYLHKTMVFGNL
jgi:hypothetical protein